MEDGRIKLKLDLSHDLYKVPDNTYVGNVSLFTEPKNGILVWTESQIEIIVKESRLWAILGTTRPVRNIMWTYQILFLDVDMKHKDGKIKFDHRFKLQYAVEPSISTPHG